MSPTIHTAHRGSLPIVAAFGMALVILLAIGAASYLRVVELPLPGADGDHRSRA